MNTVSTIGFNDSGTTVTALLASPFGSDHAVLSQVFSYSNWKLCGVHDSKAALSLLSQETIPVVISSNGDWKVLLNAGAKLPHPFKLIVSSRLMDERLWAQVLNPGRARRVGYAV